MAGSNERESYVGAAVKLTRGQLLDLLLEVEDRLKLLIRAVFSTRRPDWEKLIPEKIREDLEARRAAEAGYGSFGLPKVDLLDYADLGQLIGSVEARWALFQDVLKDKQALAAKLSEFRAWRNALAHGTQPTDDDKAKIALLTADLGSRIPVVAGAPGVPPSVSQGVTGYGLEGYRVLWVDDHPENNVVLRRWLAALGADVIPVLSNDEALAEATRRRFDLVVSDIDREDDDPGTLLGVRLQGVGLGAPIVYFIGQIRPELPLPVGAVAATNDPARLLYWVLRVLFGSDNPIGG